MRKLRGGALAAALCVGAAALAGGCGDEAPSAEAVRLHLERQLPGSSFRRDSRIHLGRFTLALARGVLRWVEPDEEVRGALSDVRRVEVVTYEVESLPPIGELELSARFERRLAEVGWTPMLVERDEDGRSWIYYREDAAGAIRNLYIVELDAVELTVIDLAGNLSRVAARMVADDPDGFLADLGS